MTRRQRRALLTGRPEPALPKDLRSTVLAVSDEGDQALIETGEGTISLRHRGGGCVEVGDLCQPLPGHLRVWRDGGRKLPPVDVPRFPGAGRAT